MMKKKTFKIERDGLYHDFQNLKKINSFSNQLLYNLPTQKSITKKGLVCNKKMLISFQIFIF